LTVTKPNISDLATSTSASSTNQLSPCAELKHIIIAFETSIIAQKLSEATKFFHDDALQVPHRCQPIDLVTIFDDRDTSVRSFDENYLRKLVNEYKQDNSRNLSSMYNEFDHACTEFLSAMEAAGSRAKSAFIYLWLLSRVLGRQVFIQCYRNVIVIPSDRLSIGLDHKKIDVFHKSIQLLMSITNAASWTPFDDERADYGVDLWCDLDQGEQIDVCKTPLGFLDRHEKVLLPITRRDLWLAENLESLFGIGRVVESAEEDKIVRQNTQSSILWTLDPANERDVDSLDLSSLKCILEYLDSSRDLSFLEEKKTEGSTDDWRTLPLVLTTEKESSSHSLTAAEETPTLVRFQRFIDETKHRKTREPHEFQKLETEIAITLIAGISGVEKSKKFTSQVFLSAKDEETLLEYDKESFWLSRYMKAALTFNRAILLCREPTVQWNLKNDQIITFHVADVLPLYYTYSNGANFTLEAGPVKWHRRVGGHSSYPKWDCLQVGRLLWDIPAKAMVLGWKRMCENFDLLGLESLTAVDCLLILAFQAAIGYEEVEGLTIPIPIFEECLESFCWQKVLPQVSMDTQRRPDCSKLDRVRPVEEIFPPFGDFLRDSDESVKAATVFLVDRSYVYPLDCQMKDELGISWEHVRIDIGSFLTTEKTDLLDYNIVVFDDQRQILNFAISRFSKLAYRRLQDTLTRDTPIRGTSKQSDCQNTKTWSAIKNLLGLERIEHPEKFEEHQDENRREGTSSGTVTGDIQLHHPAPTNFKPNVDPQLAEIGENIERVSSAPVASLRSTEFLNHEIGAGSAVVLKMKSKGVPLPCGWLGLALLPHLLDSANRLEFNWESHETCNMELGEMFITTIRRWIDEENDGGFFIFKRNLLQYSERFGKGQTPITIRDDPEVYLEILGE
jgi:hypothetical protein